MFINWIISIFDKSTYTKEELKEFDKLELEKIGRKLGIELDRRTTKTKMIKELLKVIKL
jgi:predicted kinase